MNHITYVTLLALLGICGCRETPAQPESPAPLDLLQGQVESERQGRIVAEKAALEEQQRRRRWELASVGLAMLAVAGFLAGTSLGSMGRRHAEETTR